MSKMKLLPKLAALGLAGASLAITATASAATITITEWMYNGDEFIELTNLGNAVVDFNGWSYSDSGRAPGSVSLSAFGTVQAGESVLLTESTAAAFRTTWGLTDAVKIIGGNKTQNLGRADEINIYDNTNHLVDQLTFGDEAIPGSIRTQNVSGNPASASVLGQNNVLGWEFSAVGDSHGSHAAGAFIGNPGVYVAPVPVPAALPLLLSSLAGLAAIRRRRAANV